MDGNSFQGIRALWWMLGSTASCYIVLALAYTFAAARPEGLKAPWLATVFAICLSLPFGSYGIVEDLPVRPVLAYLAIAVLPLLAYFGVITLLLSELRRGPAPGSSHVLRKLLPASLFVGAVLVLCSLFLRTTFGDPGDTGLSILAWRTSWVTAGTNVAHDVLFGPTIPWLNVFYVCAAYPIYLLALLAAIATLAGLAASRFSIERLQMWRLFHLSAALASWSCLLVISDIFWGWHFDLSNSTWAATLATALWLATLVGGAIVLLPLARGRPAVGGVATLLVFQVPLAAFNVLMLPVYFRRYSIADLPGLGCVILGLLIQSSAYAEVLFRRKGVAETKRPEVAALAA
jgi:hypothetical protein